MTTLSAKAPYLTVPVTAWALFLLWIGRDPVDVLNWVDLRARKRAAKAQR